MSDSQLLKLVAQTGSVESVVAIAPALKAATPGNVHQASSALQRQKRLKFVEEVKATAANLGVPADKMVISRLISAHGYDLDAVVGALFEQLS